VQCIQYIDFFYIHIDIQSCWHPLKSITALPHNKFIHFLCTSACSELRFELRFTLLLYSSEATLCHFKRRTLVGKLRRTLAYCSYAAAFLSWVIPLTGYTVPRLFTPRPLFLAGPSPYLSALSGSNPEHVYKGDMLYSKCTNYTTIRLGLRHARKAWPSTLLDPCLLHKRWYT
jgi:hypothetical protein